MTTDATARRLPLHQGRRAGIAMLVAIALGMAAANSPLSGLYGFIHHFPLRLGIAPIVIDAPLIDWINQGLLVVFFFHIGLHTKQEMTTGVLAARGRAILPAVAAFGGMVVPAVIFLAFNAGEPDAMRGWAIPIATDVVLVLGLMSFLGAAVSPGLLAFVTAVAIFDDLGAVLVIALFYGEAELGWSLALVAIALVGLGILNRRGSKTGAFYLLLGTLLWIGLVVSGLEGAVAGAITGLALPLSAFKQRTVERVEYRIAPLALFVVVPIFAFFNAGVPLAFASESWLTDTVVLGVVWGLVIGKPLGVALGTGLALWAGLGTLPSKTSLLDTLCAAFFAGIGFTMSLFIVTAALDDPLRADPAKVAVILGSSVSAVLASFALLALRRRRLP